MNEYASQGQGTVGCGSLLGEQTATSPSGPGWVPGKISGPIQLSSSLSFALASNPRPS